MRTNDNCTSLLALSIFLSEAKMVISSAYWIICVSSVIHEPMLRKYTSKRIGLIVEPCGVPLRERKGPTRSPSETK